MSRGAASSSRGGGGGGGVGGVGGALGRSGFASFTVAATGGRAFTFAATTDSLPTGFALDFAFTFDFDPATAPNVTEAPDRDAG